MGYNVEALRKDFPVLGTKVNGNPLVYFDNACMSLRPEPVVQKVLEYYHEYPGCAGRSYHHISQRTTEEMEKARQSIQKFIHAKKSNEIVFTKNTTESLNLVFNSLPLKKGDAVFTTDKEHNSVLVPVQMLAKTKGIQHVVVPCAEGSFSLDNFKNLLAKAKDVKLVSMVGTSNLDGTTIPIKEVAKLAHDAGALIMVDGAQFVPHHETDVQKLGVDFLAFSGHKMMGPSGTGVLYGRESLLESLPPFITGGETVLETTYSSAEFEKPPQKFEAGLQNYAGIIGLGEAVKYLSKIGLGNIEVNELAINKKISEALAGEKSVSLIGPSDPKLRGGIFNFNLGKMSPHDVAMLLDRSKNIAVRSGAHCVHSWFNAHKLMGSVRASFYAYNTVEEAGVFVEAVREIARHMAKI
jgi:cysteine desulfurase / selenocysteine lyase